MFFLYNSYRKLTQCGGCKKGFALSPSDHNPNTACLPGAIKNCELEVVYVEGPHVCLACSAGYFSIVDPVHGITKCIESSKVNNPVKNCLWGGVIKRGKATCFRCKDGYAADKTTGLCVKPASPGCLLNINKLCGVCDVFEGYSMQNNFTCSKLSGTEDFVPFLQ